MFSINTDVFDLCCSVFSLIQSCVQRCELCVDCSFSPGVVPLRAQSRQRATGLGHKLVDDQETVSAQLDQPAAALQLLG